MGQITIDSWFGNFLYQICKTTPDIRTVVEIGTWDGMGSTDCIIRGLQESNRDNISFVSLEANESMHNAAVSAWKNRLPQWASLVHGRIVEESDMDFSELSEQEIAWFAGDVDSMRTCPNALSMIPKNIDLLFLDGGEFTTQAEYSMLSSRASVVVLDDSTSRKCRNIRQAVISSKEKYSLLFDYPEIRAGVMGFKINR